MCALVLHQYKISEMCINLLHVKKTMHKLSVTEKNWIVENWMPNINIC